MCAIGILPVETKVVLQGGSLGEEGLLYAGHITQILQIIIGGTTYRKEVLLIATVHVEVETVADREGLGHLIGGLHVQIDLCGLSIVLIVTLTILKNPVGITQCLVHDIRTRIDHVREVEGVLHECTTVGCILASILVGESQAIR